MNLTQLLTILASTDVETFRFMVQPFIAFFMPLIVGSFGTSGIVEFLKSKKVPLPVEKYPRLSNVVLSLAASTAAIYLTPANLVLETLWQRLGFVLGWFLLSAFWYNNVFKSNKQ